MMVRIGIIGFGTVGSGSVKIILRNSELIKKRSGVDIRTVKIADLDITRDRGVKLPEGILTQNALEVIDNPEIDIVVELIGGMHPAKDFILRAIRNKKHVVTANKALLAEDGEEIFNESKAYGVMIGFEASVAGGIPIIKVIREGLVANRFISIYGIINGTSNYILTKMTHEGISFQESLREAQRQGFAEADPTLDVEGIDATHKLTLLSSLAFGIPLSYKSIYREGITGITPIDITFAKELGYSIKLLAIAKLIDGELELRVHPTMIPEDYLISKVEGVFNAVYIEGDAVGPTLYYGRGAGDTPTGSAVVSDIIDIARRIKSPEPTSIGEGYNDIKLKDIGEIKSMYYFRFTAMDRPGVLSKISGILGEHNISIASVIQKGRRVGGAVPLVILTHTAMEKDVKKALSEIDMLSVVADKTFLLRVEGREEDIIK